MKLYCPHCKSPVGSPPIKSSDGLLDCHNCKKPFRIINALENAPEVNRVRREPEFRSGIVSAAADVTFYFRGKAPIALLLIYSILGCVLTISAIINYKAMYSFEERFIAAVAGVFFLFSFLRTITEQEDLQIQTNSIVYTKAQFGFRTIKTQPRTLFSKVYEDVEYDSYKTPSFYLRMEFSNGEGFRFGNNLTHNERVWLIGEIEAAIKGNEIKSETIV